MTSLEMNEEYEFFGLLKDHLEEIRFRKIPHEKLLNQLYEVQEKHCLFAFSRSQSLGDISDIAETAWSHQIRSARMKSDAFCEHSHEWFEFSKMEELTICAKMGEGSFFDSEQLGNALHDITEGMQELRSLKILLACSKEAFSEAESYLIASSHSQFKCKLIHEYRSKRRR